MRMMWIFMAVLSLIAACGQSSGSGTEVIDMAGHYQTRATLTNETQDKTMWSRSMSVTVGQGNRGIDFSGVMFEALDDRIVTDYCLDSPLSEGFEYFVRTCYSGDVNKSGGDLWIDIGMHVQGEERSATRYRFQFEDMQKQENPYVDS